MTKKTLTYPCIFVERPHQMPGKTWIAYEEADVTGQLADNRYGDNWDFSQWDSVEDIEQCYGCDREDWPEELRETVETGIMPVVETSRCGVMWCGSVDEADELEFAIDYIGHDLRSLDVLESKEEAEQVLSSNKHNVPYESLRDDMDTLGWIE
jgi:hypothetical protein